MASRVETGGQWEALAVLLGRDGHWIWVGAVVRLRLILEEELTGLPHRLRWDVRQRGKSKVLPDMWPFPERRSRQG